MYLRRISTWGVLKHNKKEDMLFILHKTAQREAKGKNTSFSVRDRVVETEEIHRFLKRKKVVLDPADPPTPRHITYRTPSPPATERTLSHRPEEEENTNSSERSLELAQDSSTPSPKECCEVMTRYLPNGYSLSYLPKNVVLGSISPCPEIFRQPCSSQHLLVPEHIFSNITAFCDDTLSLKDGEGEYGGETEAGDNFYYHEFRDYCRAASSLLHRKAYIEARRMLSHAFALVRGIIECGEPQYLDTVIQGLIRFLEEGHVDIVRMFQAYMTRMAAAVAENNKCKRPSVTVYSLIGMVDVEQLSYVFLQSWRCINDGFERNIGRFHLKNSCSYVAYYQCVYGGISVARLASLISECELVRGPDNYASFNLIYSLGALLIKEGRYAEANETSLTLLLRARRSGYKDVEYWGLRNLAKGYYGMGNKILAEINQRATLELMEADMGRTNPQVINEWVRLETWMREWGWDEDADKLRLEIQCKTGIDEVDEDEGTI
jgi:tetratricopeptide (TPR) repeat protein